MGPPNSDQEAENLSFAPFKFRNPSIWVLTSFYLPYRASAFRENKLSRPHCLPINECKASLSLASGCVHCCLEKMKRKQSRNRIESSRHQPDLLHNTNSIYHVSVGTQLVSTRDGSFNQRLSVSVTYIFSGSPAN